MKTSPFVNFDAELRLTRFVAERASGDRVAVVIVSAVRLQEVSDTLGGDVFPEFPRVVLCAIALPFD